MNISLFFLLALVACVICEGDVQKEENVIPAKVRRPHTGREEVEKDANDLEFSAEKIMKEYAERKERFKKMLRDMDTKTKPYWEDTRLNQETIKAKQERLRKMKDEMRASDIEKFGRKVTEAADKKLLAYYKQRRDEKKDTEEVKALRQLEEQLRSLFEERRVDEVENDADVNELREQLIALRKKILRKTILDDTFSEDNEIMRKLLEQRQARGQNVESRQAMMPNANNPFRGRPYGGQMRKPNQNPVNSFNPMNSFMPSFDQGTIQLI